MAIRMQAEISDLIPGQLTHVANPAVASTEVVYSKALQQLISLTAADQAQATISNWPGYAVTPLHCLDGLAARASLGTIWYKDESQRFGLQSFKALGGAYAVICYLLDHIAVVTGHSATIEDLLDGRYQAQLLDVVVSCATDGNHGRSVAWGAHLFGCQCIIYIHRDVSAGRQQAIEVYGAEVIRVSGNYDDSVRQAAADAEQHGRVIISDTSYEGYTQIPTQVALGYTVMLAEIVEQLQGQVPSHVFVQGGVGGLAAAVCAYFWQTWGIERPRFIIVEPEQANCLQASAKAGSPQVIEGDLETLMAGLACGEVSVIAWQILHPGVNDFLTISEAAVAPTMRMLAAGCDGDISIEAGESAVPGLAAALVATADSYWSQCLGLDQHSRILVLGTEGATDPHLYRQIMEAG
jgi:diaminopropionate ammonia-lyase